MRRNCIYKYIVKNQPQKDLIVYQYGDKQEYLIHHKGHSCYDTYDLNDMNRHVSNIERDTIWVNSNILAIYEQDNNIYLQVNWNH
jgi:hypothetical protein